MFSLAPSESSVRHFKPETVEVQYTIRLSDWWKDICAATVSFGGDELVSARNSRTHQLLSEAGEVGYFDCTVEVSKSSIWFHGFTRLIYILLRSCMATPAVATLTPSSSPTTLIIRALHLSKRHGVLLSSRRWQCKLSCGTRPLSWALPCKLGNTILSAICG